MLMATRWSHAHGKRQSGPLPLGIADLDVEQLSDRRPLPAPPGSRISRRAIRPRDLKNELGASPLLCLGQVFYVEQRGEKPIAITWHLRRAMTGEMFGTASVVAS